MANGKTPRNALEREASAELDLASRRFDLGDAAEVGRVHEAVGVPQLAWSRALKNSARVLSFTLS